ncbi:MAG: hypothetical protein EOP84_17980 [Verrucomicrobiaceae bacterium]|nr:MAG: hypothetical protein EOP84_17980 [Verrucomicrobiaceae bacterium]
MNGNLESECFLSVEKTEEDLCRSMWIGVILQAVIDAGGSNCNRVDRDAAVRWLKGPGDFRSDFAAVCDLAGIDFERTRERCAAMLRGDVPTVDFRSMKKALPANRTSENRKRYFRRAERNAKDRNQRRNLLARASRPESRSLPANDNHANDNLINQPTENE